MMVCQAELVEALFSKVQNVQVPPERIHSAGSDTRDDEVSTKSQVHYKKHLQIQASGSAATF